MKAVCILLDENVFEKLQSQKEKNGTPVTFQIRKAVDRYLEVALHE